MSVAEFKKIIQEIPENQIKFYDHRGVEVKNPVLIKLICDKGCLIEIGEK